MKQDKIISEINTSLCRAFQSLYPGVDTSKVVVSVPTDKKKADFVSNAAFTLVKDIGNEPRLIAQEVVSEFKNVTSKYKAEAAPQGFINFRISDLSLSMIIDTIVNEPSTYGSNDMYKNQTWVIEHTSPNPNKAMHVGHLRNNLIGMSIANLLEFSGAKVVRDWIDNDRGIAIAKAMWGYLVTQQKTPVKTPGYNLLHEWCERPENWYTPEECNIKPDHFIGDCYMSGSDLFKSDESSKQITRTLALNWENNDSEVWELWRFIIQCAHAGIFSTLERIGNKWDNAWHEHEHYKQGKDLVLAGLEQGAFRQLPDGAILTNLENYNLPDTVALKSDGTSLYITQDIALTKLKKDKYKADRLVWVIGPEQSIAMKQVFAICEQLGIGELSDFIHIPYGLIAIDHNGQRKKMSSRGGEVLLIDTLLDTVQDTVMKKDRGYTPEEADKIAVAAVKFATLKPARNTDTILDVSQIVNLEGDSGVYILYTMARIRALLVKVPLESDDNEEWNYNELERTLIVNLSYFPNVVKNATTEFAPSTLVDYSLEVARLFNTLYARERFISDNESSTRKKLYIAKACLIVLDRVAKILGLPNITKV